MSPKVGMIVEYTDSHWERSWAEVTKVWRDDLVNLKTVSKQATSVPYNPTDTPNTWRFVGEYISGLKMPNEMDADYEAALRSPLAPPVPVAA
jgi:hypothetical protein